MGCNQKGLSVENNSLVLFLLFVLKLDDSEYENKFYVTIWTKTITTNITILPAY